MKRKKRVYAVAAWGYGQRLRHSLDVSQAAAPRALPMISLERERRGGRKRQACLTEGVASVGGTAWTTSTGGCCASPTYYLT